MWKHRKFKMKFATFLIVVNIFITVEGWPCVYPIERVFNRINANAVLQFSADLTNLNSPRRFTVKYYNGTTIAQIRYYTNKSSSTDSLSRVRITGDQTGKISLTLESVQEDDYGIYSLNSAGFKTKCSCVYILGKPTKSIIGLNNVTFVGDQVTLTCKSTSNTMPRNHSLGLIYNWKVDTTLNPTGTRYSYSANKENIKVSDVLQNDKNILFSCSASENVSEGYTSEWSTHKSFDVYYGPEEAEIDAQSPVYVTEGYLKKEIHCTSDCHPICTFKWTNLTSGLSVGIDGTLPLTRIRREMSGNYTCIANNTASPTKKYARTTINIVVKYPPTVEINPSTTDIIEGKNLTLNCIGIGVPSQVSYISFTQTTNGIPILNPNIAPSHVKQYGTIYFSSLTFQDTGIYTCKLNNGITDTSGDLNQLGHTRISVKVRPIVLTDELRFSGSNQGAAIIKIPFYSYPSVSRVFLSRYDGHVVSSDKYNIFVGSIETSFYSEIVRLNGSFFKFEIKDLTENDFGNYSLKLTNEIGTTAVNTSIVAEGRPSPPISFQYQQRNNVPTFVWKKNFNGGLAQTFVIQIAVAGTDLWENKSIIFENDKKYKINSTFYSTEIRGLKPGIYTARLFSKNNKGASEALELGETFEVVTQTANSAPIAAIAGGCSAILLIFLIGGMAIIWYRRRSKTKSGGNSKQPGVEFHGKDDDQESEVDTVNPMYVPADELPDNLYAQPLKKSKSPVENSLYGHVKKKKDREKLETGEESEVKTYPKGKKKAEVEKKRVNKDGLIYADLEFNDKQAGYEIPKIRNTDSMTEYVEVDFTKKADPLPESDEENSSTKK